MLPKICNIMINNKPVSFSNTNYQIFIILTSISLALIFIFASLLLDFNWKGFSSGLCVYILLNLLIIHPYKYVISDNNLRYRFLLRKARIINIDDIIELDVSKNKWLSCTYLPAGFKTPTYERIRLNKNKMDIFREELMKRNPRIQILYT